MCFRSQKLQYVENTVLNLRDMINPMLCIDKQPSSNKDDRESTERTDLFAVSESLKTSGRTSESGTSENESFSCAILMGRIFW